MPDFYSNYLIYFQDIKTGTKVDLDKAGVTRLFEYLLNEKPGSKQELEGVIYPVMNGQ
jgi:hypothetical protein